MKPTPPDREDIQKRGLVTTGHHLPYNPRLVNRAKTLRKTMTDAEKKLWHEFLKVFPFRVLRQRPIDNFIVDFYCPKLKLVIEIDGEQHAIQEGKMYDNDRDGILESYGLTVMRIPNRDIYENFDEVCKKIRTFGCSR